MAASFTGPAPSVSRGPDPTAGLCRPHASAGDTHSKSGSVSCGDAAPSPGPWCAQGPFCALQESVSLLPQSCGSSALQPHWPPKSDSLGVPSPFAGSITCCHGCTLGKCLASFQPRPKVCKYPAGRGQFSAPPSPPRATLTAENRAQPDSSTLVPPRPPDHQGFPPRRK